MRKRLQFFAAAVLLVQQSVVAQELSLFDVSPVISESAEPNLVLTFDDSRSMHYGFVPDAVGQLHMSKAAKSSHFNKLYYDPAVTYLPPVRADGESYPAANFRAALTNPFNGAQIETANAALSVSGDDGSRIRLEPVRNTVDLQTSYVVRWNVASGTAEQQPTEVAYPIIANDVSGATAAYYYRYDAARSMCDAVVPGDDDCYEQVVITETSGVSRARPELGIDTEGNTIVSSDERQNFANWYQYHSLRVLMAKTAVSRALAPGNINGGVRVARQTFSHRTPQSGTQANLRSTVTPLNEDRANLYDWLFKLREGENSRLRSAMQSAAQFLGNDDIFRQTPWLSATPGDALACRNSYHLMVTDGLWSMESEFNFPGSEDADNVAVTLPDNTRYPIIAPIYAQARTRTVADLAFHYWATDLNSLPNDVKPVFRRRNGDSSDDYWDYRNDPAKWQHITMYAMSFGVTSDVPVTAQALDEMLDGGTFTNNRGEQQGSWPDGGLGDGDETWKIDDLYHATINSRGDFFSVQNPETFSQAMAAFASAITVDHVSYSPVAANTSAVAAGTVLYRAEYNGAINAGDVKAFQVANGDNTPCAGAAGTLCPTPLWRANHQGSAPSATVFTYDPVAQRGVPFSAAGFSSAMRDALRAPGENDGRVSQRIDYVRGVSSVEQANGGPFRNRSTYQRAMGPVINSAPVFVGNGFNANGSRELGYPDDLEAQLYSEFLENISDRVPMIYVGANDGKLHALNALTGNTVFDYVPNAVFASLKSMSRPSYSYKPSVDGLINTADVFIGDEWKTVLIGALRTGGKGIYALDVTDPADTEPENKVLWELTSNSPDAEKLGYVFGRVSIVKSNIPASLAGGSATKWVAVFGNGYNSTGGEAVLFVVDLETGEVIRSISTQPASPSPEETTSNGLAAPAVVFVDDNFTADYVYAGDLRGNLWKFDISSSRPQDWRVAYDTSVSDPESAAYDPEPLFVAVDSDGEPQPITAAPVVAGHPAGRAGFMIYFGTGKYIEASDHSSETVQTFYGVWDKDMCGGAGLVSCIAVAPDARSHVNLDVDRGDLTAQQITGVSVGERIVSDVNVNWQTQFGWRMDFPAGERVIAQARLRSGLVLFPTFTPGENACTGMGSSWLMALSRVNGGLLDHRPFTRNNGDLGNNNYGQQRAAGVSIDTQLNEVSILGCGGRSCIISDAEGGMEQMDEGMHWGRWQWLKLQSDAQ